MAQCFGYVDTAAPYIWCWWAAELAPGWPSCLQVSLEASGPQQNPQATASPEQYQCRTPPEPLWDSVSPGNCSLSWVPYTRTQNNASTNRTNHDLKKKWQVKGCMVYTYFFTKGITGFRIASNMFRINELPKNNKQQKLRFQLLSHLCGQLCNFLSYSSHGNEKQRQTRYFFQQIKYGFSSFQMFPRLVSVFLRLAVGGQALFGHAA